MPRFRPSSGLAEELRPTRGDTPSVHVERVELVKGHSGQVEWREESALDFVFIDGDHAYEGARREPEPSNAHGESGDHSGLGSSTARIRGADGRPGSRALEAAPGCPG